ncbi:MULTISPECIES: hypothetical protein [unclassified Micromonospora]|uniref:hypothetical protein n=1 Tax=unclassified Micromonospora TaxID=2617518 RepID=UPI002FF18387
MAESHEIWRMGAEHALPTHIRPTHHGNVHFYGTHSVHTDGELAQLDADGYRPPRLPNWRREADRS